jgi:hypothetical protein
MITGTLRFFFVSISYVRCNFLLSVISAYACTCMLSYLLLVQFFVQFKHGALQVYGLIAKMPQRMCHFFFQLTFLFYRKARG